MIVSHTHAHTFRTRLLCCLPACSDAHAHERLSVYVTLMGSTPVGHGEPLQSLVSYNPTCNLNLSSRRCTGRSLAACFQRRIVTPPLRHSHNPRAFTHGPMNHSHPDVQVQRDNGVFLGSVRVGSISATRDRGNECSASHCGAHTPWMHRIPRALRFQHLQGRQELRAATRAGFHDQAARTGRRDICCHQVRHASEPPRLARWHCLCWRAQRALRSLRPAARRNRQVQDCVIQRCTRSLPMCSASGTCGATTKR